MKALIQKDLKENVKVALIGLLILSLLVIGAYISSLKMVANVLTETPGWNAGFVQPLLSPSLLGEAGFFCAIFGAALGWLQARNEGHRDLWAFLIHRPVTRTEIFCAKSIAGLCLYVFGAGVPLVILVAVVRMPGHIAAPFEWAMALPLVSIFLAGAAYYFAGMLTGLRHARWYARRSFGIAVAITASAMVFSLPEFWQMLIVIAIAVIILATAVWGGYQNGGYYDGQPPAGRLALIVAMTAGCGGAVLAGAGLLFIFVFASLSQSSFEFSGYRMNRDGAIYKVTLLNNKLKEIVDLNGNPLLDAKTGRKMEAVEFNKLRAEEAGVSRSFNDRKNRKNFQAYTRFFDCIKVADNMIWYLDRHGKLTGYDARTREFAGSVNPQGDDGNLTSQPFLSAEGYSVFFHDESRGLAATGKSIYQVDFKNRAAKPVLTVANGDEIDGYNAFYVSKDENSPRYLLLATRKTVSLFDSGVRPIFTTPCPAGYFDYSQVNVNFLRPASSSTTNFALWFIPDPKINSKSDWKMPIHVLWLGADHAVAKSVDLPVLHTTKDDPLLVKLAMTMLPPFAHAIVDKNIYDFWSVVSFALAVISAVIGCGLARRYNFSASATAGWTLFIFLVGIAGLLGMLCAQEWPVRESCPKCTKLRTVDREYCEHCGSPFSPPEKNGTEIFGPLAKV